MRAAMLFMLMLISLTANKPTCAPLQPKQAAPPQPEFAMGPRYVFMPEKFFLLVRKGREIGALRFTRIEQDADGNGKSEYESFFQGDGSGSFLNSAVVKRIGEIDIKPMRGIHAFAWQPGQNKLEVGKWWFGCYSPNLVNMSLNFSEDDQGFEFAPTSAQSIAEINTTDKRLRWFRYLPNSSVDMPVSGLPK
jgi:hypothetical protein